MKKRVFLIIPIIISMLTACNQPTPDTSKGYFVGPDAPEGAITTVGENKALINNDTTLEFEKNDDGTLGVYFYKVGTHTLIAYNKQPAQLSVRGADRFGVYEVDDYFKGYDGVEETNYGYHCVSIVTTKQKSQFRIMDSYYISEEYGFTVDRKVTVLEAKIKDVGYESVFTLRNGGHSRDIENFDYFIPGSLYKDPQYNASSALITSLFNARVLVKETRGGLPMTMVRDKTTNNYFAIVHAEPNISVHGELGGGADGAVDDDLEYGSVGFENEYKGDSVDIGVQFCYPCAEGPATFDAGAGWCRRFHQVETRHFHEYKVGLVFGNTETFNDALVDSYEKSYMFVDATCEKTDNVTAYQQNIDLFSKEYIAFYKDKAQTVMDSCGVPWELNLDGSKARGPYSFQMGFVGQQTSVGAHLYRQGLSVPDNTGDYKQKGINIVDFWCSKTIMPDGNLLPYIWYEGAYKSLHTQGTAGYSTIYLRQLCDGLEGILDAYLYGLEFGEFKADWLAYVTKVMNNLITTQNGDGSFNRAYDKNGGIPGAEFNDSNIGYDPTDPAKFKINTPVAVKILAKLYSATKDPVYFDCMIKAADYSYTNIYEKMGKYVGGTCDNANVVDKEAAIYAMYGFRYAYDVLMEELNNMSSGDEHYEEYKAKAEQYEHAMRHATCCALSWTFMYDFACPANEQDEKFCAYVDGHTMGASVIATGHAGVDGFACYMWYDVFKVYELTGNEVYKKAAILLENCVKLFTDYYGTHGWRYSCVFPEACQVSDFTYKPTNYNGSLWLPWCGVGQMNPIISTYLDFGVYQLEDVVLKK